MVFPRAMLDKTVSPTVMTSVGGSFVLGSKLEVAYICLCLGHSKTRPGCGTQLVRIGLGGSARQLVAGLLVYYCFLPFTRLEARPALELIGPWSGVNSRAHTAWQLPPGQSRQAGEVTAKLLQVKKTTPENTVLDRWSPTLVWKIIFSGTST